MGKVSDVPNIEASEPLLANDPDEHFRREEEAAASEHHDAQVLALLLWSYLGGWTLLCLAVAINHWLAFLCLFPPALLLFFVKLREAYAIGPRKRASVAKFRAKNGRRSQFQRPEFPFLGTAAVAVIAAIGFWLSTRYLNEGQMPGLYGEGFQPVFALELWLLVTLVMAAGMSVSTGLIVLAFMLWARGSSKPMQEFDPTIGPEAPTNLPRRPATLLNCFVPLYASLGFEFLAGVGIPHFPWFLIAAFGMIIGVSLALWQLHCLDREIRRLQLYIDWRKTRKPDEEIQEEILKSKEHYDDEKTKWGSVMLWFAGTFWLGTMSFVQYPQGTRIKDISRWSWLYYAVVLTVGGFGMHRACTRLAVPEGVKDEV